MNAATDSRALTRSIKHHVRGTCGAIAIALSTWGCAGTEFEPQPHEEGVGSEVLDADELQLELNGHASATATIPDFSQPLSGLTADELARFEAGRDAFEEVETVDEGLGPIFNERGCANCHSLAGTGGGSDVLENRFGRVRADGTFDSLQELGGTLQQVFTIGSEGTPPGCTFPAEVIPPSSNVRALRRTTPLFGLGLVNNIPDDDLRDLARRQRKHTPETAGKVAIATDLTNTQPQVSRFGWKAQVPNLFVFSANAYNNEMGITTPLFPLENCPNGLPDCPLIQQCDPVPGVDDDNEDVQLFTDFMNFLAPPFRGPVGPAENRGEVVFSKIGCADCHEPTHKTGPNAVKALHRKKFHPYSDFLLHDMGSLSDGIGPDQGNATNTEVNAAPTEMRTAPLWGLRALNLLLHDGRAKTIPEAILAHQGQGAASRNRFKALNRTDRQNLIAFLNSL